MCSEMSQSIPNRAISSEMPTVAEGMAAHAGRPLTRSLNFASGASGEGLCAR
jgi:hypothetical protein